jgi:hypothetical protein
VRSKQSWNTLTTTATSQKQHEPNVLSLAPLTASRAKLLPLSRKESNHMTDNPLQKYVDAFDKQNQYVQPVLTAQVGQYLLKALDYLTIYSTAHDQPELVEQPRHTDVEDMLTDVIMYAPEEDVDG